MTSPDPTRLPRLLLFPASLRRHSHQRRLIEHIAGRIASRCRVDLLAAEQVGLPLFNQDLEADPAVLDQVRRLHQRVAGADGIIVASPEYNGHVSPFLKNTVDWISRLARIDPACAGQGAFRGKPLLLASASTGWTGGILGLRDARAIFGYLGCLVAAEQICVSDAELWASDAEPICVSDAAPWTTGRGFRFEPGFAARIDAILAGFLELATTLAGAGAPEGTDRHAHVPV